MGPRKLIAYFRKRVSRYEDDPFLCYSDVSVLFVFFLTMIALCALLVFEHIATPLMYNLH